MCSYFLNSKGEEFVDCFDPTTNDGQFYATGCYKDVSVEDEMGHKQKGKFCICNGDRHDLCNEDYMKKSPDSGAPSNIINTLTLFISVFFFCSL